MARATNKRKLLKEVGNMQEIDIQREKDEMDAIEAREAELLNEQIEAQGFVKCKACEHWTHKDYLLNGVCGSCIDDIFDTVTLEDAFEYASALYNSEDIVDNELELYTEYLFTREEAIEILKREAREAVKINKNTFDKEIKDFINNDTYHYLDYLKEKGEL